MLGTYSPDSNLRFDPFHGQLGKAPHLIEITRDKRVLWTFFDHQTMSTVSSVQLLDVPGDATKGEVWH